MAKEEYKLVKDMMISKLREALIYPESVNKKVWKEAKIINQKILNLINEIIEL